MINSIFFAILLLILNVSMTESLHYSAPFTTNSSAVLNNENNTVSNTVVVVKANTTTTAHHRRTATPTPTATPVASPTMDAPTKIKKTEVTLRYVAKDGTTTLIPLGSLDDIPLVRRLVTRAPKGRLMLRHPSDPTTTWSVNEDQLYDWLLDNALPWAHDNDYEVDNGNEQDDNENNNNSNNKNQQQQQQEQNETAAPQSSLSLKDAICTSFTNAVNQLKAWIQTLLWWTATVSFVSICLWVAVMALTIDLEANRQCNHFQREQEMVRVASCHAAVLRQNNQRPFFLCPQQWEEKCLDEAMKQLYNVSYYETRHYQDRNNNNNNNSSNNHCMSYSTKQVYHGYQQQPAQSQIYRSYY